MLPLGDDDAEFKDLKDFVGIMKAYRAVMSRGDMLGFKDLDELVDVCKADNRCPYEMAADTQWFREPENLDDNIAKAIHLLHDARIAPFPSGRALCLAVGHDYIKTAQTLVDLGICDPLTARDKEQSNGTILHSAAWSDAWSDADSSFEKAYRLAPSLIHAIDDDGKTPLDVLIVCNRHSDARFLFERGALLNFDTYGPRGDIKRAFKKDVYMQNGMDMVKFLFANGGWVDPPSNYHPADDVSNYIKTLFARFRRCARAAVAVLGLNHVGCKTQGNGRDALQLIARMIWVYRVDEVWGDYEEKDDDELQERLANASSEEDDEEEEESDQVDGGEPPQKKVATE